MTCPLRIENGYTFVQPGSYNDPPELPTTLGWLLHQSVMEHAARVYLLDMTRYLWFVPTYAWLDYLASFFGEWHVMVQLLLDGGHRMPPHNVQCLVGIVGLYSFMQKTNSLDVPAATMVLNDFDLLVADVKRHVINPTMKQAGLLRLGAQLYQHIIPANAPAPPPPPAGSRHNLANADVDRFLMGLVRSNNLRLLTTEMNNMVKMCFDTVPVIDQVIAFNTSLVFLLGPILAFLNPLEMVARAPIVKKFHIKTVHDHEVSYTVMC
jgi:hypothetical protein